MDKYIELNKIKIFSLGIPAINILSDLDLNRSEFSKIVFSLNRIESCSINIHISEKENNFDFIFHRDHLENNFNLENTLFDLNASFKGQVNIFLGVFITPYFKKNDFKIKENYLDTKEDSLKNLDLHFLSYLDKVLEEATKPNSFSSNKSLNMCVIVMPPNLLYNFSKEKINIDPKKIEKEFYDIVKEKTKKADLTIYIDDYNRVNNLENCLSCEELNIAAANYLNGLFESKKKNI